MVFSTSSFLFLFLPGTVLIYFLIHTCTGSAKSAANIFLFLASMVFYCWGGYQHAFILLSVVLISYTAGLLIDLSSSKAGKKLFLTLGIISLAGILAYYKYRGFFIDTIAALSGKDHSPIEVVLPIGISFFTFQALSYVIDVYRGERALRSPLDLGMYITFFPQLIAGPIIRYSQIKVDIFERHAAAEDVFEGLERFFVGLCKKVIFANNLGALADSVFNRDGVASLPALMVWLAAIAYTLQIYYDFSGYSDMAIGLGRIFGFHFPENFNYPYAASSVTDFWRRWHISLSSWFRDYLYIPLGGSRKGTFRHILNLFIVWSVTGLWHGASWKYVLWGLAYFALLVIEKYVVKPDRFKSAYVKGLFRVLTILCVIFLWVIFRAGTLSFGISMLGALFGMEGNGWFSSLVPISFREYWFYLIFGAVFSLPVLKVLQKNAALRVQRLIPRIQTAVIFIGTIIAISMVLGEAYNPFIYYMF